MTITVMQQKGYPNTQLFLRGYKIGTHAVPIIYISVQVDFINNAFYFTLYSVVGAAVPSVMFLFSFSTTAAAMLL